MDSVESHVQRYVCNFPFEKNLAQKFIVKTEWREKQAQLTIMDLNCAWTGQITKELITSWSKLLEKDEDEYLEEVKVILTTNGGLPQFSYSLENNTFTWKKNVEADFKVKFGSVSLKKIPVELVANEFLDVLSFTNKTLSKKIQCMKETNKVSEEDQTQLKLRLESYRRTKNLEEEQLYNKFAAILNSKKEEICKLHRIIDRKFSVKDILINHSKAYKDLIQNKTCPYSTTNDPFDSDTDVDTDKENEDCAEIESSVSNSMEVDTVSEGSQEIKYPSKHLHLGSDLDEDSPPLILTNQLQSSRLDNYVPVELHNLPGPSNAQPVCGVLSDGQNSILLNEKLVGKESSPSLVYDTQDLFDNL